METLSDFIFVVVVVVGGGGGVVSSKSLQIVIAVMKLKDAYSLEETL